MTNNNKSYGLSIVNISPTVQEFCTPAPGDQVICSVNSYLFNQLWLPALLLLAGTIGLGFLLRYWLSLQHKWDMTFEIDGDSDSIHHFKLKPGSTERLSLGSGFGSSEDWGYLQRRGNRLFHVIPSSNVKRENDRKLNLISVATSEENSYPQRKRKDEHEIKTLNKETKLTCTASNGDRYEIVIQVKR